MNKNLPIKKLDRFIILLIFGSFCIGYNIAIAFHELGHAFAIMLDGGQIQEFALNPFSWSWTLGRNVHNPLFTAWGGVIFGLLFAVLPAIVFIRAKKYYFRVPLLVLAGSAFLINGIYLMTGVFLGIGDGGELIQYGVSSAFILILGLVYFSISLFIWAVIQQLLGLHSNVSFYKRSVILLGGITPYLMMMFLYNLLFNKEQIAVWSSFAIMGVITCFIFSISGQFWAKKFPRSYRLDFDETSYRPVAAVSLMGVLLIIAELVIFGIRDNPF